MKRYYILTFVTAVIVALGFLLTKLGLGWKFSTPTRWDKPLIKHPILWEKFTTLNNLEVIGRRRPYTEKEMQLLRRAIHDPYHEIRAMAIAALENATHDPKQREEAIKLIMPCLKDPEWLVRSYAVRALARLKVKDAVPHILPLLNDPRPEVREAAEDALKELGYQVRK
ncbi:MAG: HEAT repeat domain-containing protein [Armatimonadota bacterium]